MTAVDDLEVGQWVAITQEYDPQVGFFGGQINNVTGTPLKILAISLPFICVKDAGDKEWALDVRRFSLQKLSEEYVAAMQGKSPEEMKPAEQKVGPYGNCPICREPLKHRLLEGEREWKYVCDGCDFQATARS